MLRSRDVLHSMSRVYIGRSILVGIVCFLIDDFGFLTDSTNRRGRHAVLWQKDVLHRCGKFRSGGPYRPMFLILFESDVPFPPVDDD